MRNLSGKVAVITGAGSGIGRATALALARKGVRLVVCDIDQGGLEKLNAELASIGATVAAHRVDVSDRVAMKAFADAVHAECEAIDILVNCAGVYVAGRATNLSLEDWDWVLSINLWGTILACHYFVPPMVQRAKGGHVVNLASMYGFWPSPCVIGYLTSKFAVFGFSQALREDLRPYGIGVSAICPGMVRTGIVRNMRIRTAPGEEDSVRSALERSYRQRDYGPENVARAVVRAIRRNRGLVLVSPESRIMHQLERFLPRLSRWIARRAAARMFNPPSSLSGK